MAEDKSVRELPQIPKRILIVRTGAIGDVTNALVLAEALKATGLVEHLGWVIHPLSLPIVQGHPAVDQLHVLRRDGGMKEWLRLRCELRQEQYDLAIDAQRILKSAILTRMSGAPRRLGFDRKRSKEGSWLFHKDRIQPSGGPHMVDWYLEFAEALGLKNPSPRRRLPRDESAEAWADRQLAGLPCHGAANPAPICVHIGGTKAAKRWAPSRYGDLLELLKEEDMGPVILTGGPSDRTDADEALKGGLPGLDLVGKTTLPELIALLRRCRAWVGCDTGPMHIAAALDCPVVALFGTGEPMRTGPYGQGHQVLGVSEVQHAPSLAEVTADAVLAALSRIPSP